MIKFNDRQLEAINSINGTVQVIAAAGSGKSSVLVERILNMINNHNINPDDILAISFTNASATDLKKKLAEKGVSVLAGTFHIICKMLLEEIGYKNLTNFPNVYKVKREMEIQTKEKNLNMRDIISWIDYQKAHGLSYNHFLMEKESIYSNKGLLRDFFKIYETFNRNNECYDFNDWMNLTLKEYEKGRIKRKWKYVLVDECQDLSAVQHKLVDLFCSTDNIFEVGDGNQVLYEFRGATPELFQNFDKSHPKTKVINMNTNYRSCNNIVEAANHFIRPYNKNYDNYTDSIAYNKENGNIEYNNFISKVREAKYVVDKIKKMLDDGVNPKDIAILYRNHSCSDYIEKELTCAGIEYKTFNENSFFDRKEIKGILSILKLTIDSNNDEAFEDLLNSRFYPVTYYKSELIDKLRIDAGKRNYSMYEAFIDYNFKADYENKNRDILIDMIGRLKIQKEKFLPADKIIENIIKMFKVKDALQNLVDYETYIDKLDSIGNFVDMGKNIQMDYFVKMCSSGNIKRKKQSDCIELRTIHSSKGLEWDTTFLVGLESDKFPNYKSDVLSEARLMYVGITRAKKNLYVSCIDYSDFYKEYTSYFGGTND